jgi:NNP family nitrate/nitrite transporter-like MFS transporter
MAQDPINSGTIRAQAGTLFLIFIIFYLNMLSRLGLAPLLPGIESELGLRHVEAGSLFFFISVGYGSGLFSSAFMAARLGHPHLIALSSAAVGSSLVLVSFSNSLWTLRTSFLALGFAGGLYLPSGVALLTGLVRRQHWGKVLAVHQLAPNLAYVCSPWMAAMIMGHFSWRFAVAVYGVAAIIMAGVFLIFGRSDGFRSEAPSIGLVRRLVKTPAIWIMILLFGLALGVNQGLFSILPLYLAVERQLDTTMANHMLAISRIVAFAMPLLAGWISDRYGLKKTLFATVAASSIATLSVPLAPADWLGMGLILQAVASVCFFPLGFAVLSRVTSKENRNTAVGFTVPFGYLIGVGIVPTIIGYAGDAGSFGWGIGLLGILTITGLILLRFIRLS